MERYEERSNPIMRFVEQHCIEEANDTLTIIEFTNRCNNYLKERHLRIMTANQIGRLLRNEGFTVGARTIDGISAVRILGLRIK